MVMELKEVKQKKGWVEHRYEDNAVINHFKYDVIYCNFKLRVTYDISTKQWAWGDAYTMQSCPNLTQYSEEELFQASTLIDVESILTVQKEIIKILKGDYEHRII